MRTTHPMVRTIIGCSVSGERLDRQHGIMVNFYAEVQKRSDILPPMHSEWLVGFSGIERLSLIKIDHDTLPISCLFYFCMILYSKLKGNKIIDLANLDKLVH